MTKPRENVGIKPTYGVFGSFGLMARPGYMVDLEDAQERFDGWRSRAHTNPYIRIGKLIERTFPDCIVVFGNFVYIGANACITTITAGLVEAFPEYTVFLHRVYERELEEAMKLLKDVHEAPED